MAAATNIFRLKAAERKAALKAQLEHAAQGGEVDPDQILADGTAIGVSHGDVARVLDVLTERFERTQTFRSIDWDSKIADAKAESLASVTAMNEASAAAEAAREACRAANERHSRAVALHQQAVEAKKTAAKEYDQFMKSTAGSGRDTTDWRNVAF